MGHTTPQKRNGSSPLLTCILKTDQRIDLSPRWIGSTLKNEGLKPFERETNHPAEPFNPFATSCLMLRSWRRWSGGRSRRSRRCATRRYRSGVTALVASSGLACGRVGCRGAVRGSCAGRRATVGRGRCAIRSIRNRSGRSRCSWIDRASRSASGCSRSCVARHGCRAGAAVLRSIRARHCACGPAVSRTRIRGIGN
jgi:hypothetical protein